MRELFTLEELRGRGLSREQIRTGVKHGRWRRLVRGVYGEGAEEPSALDLARAAVVAACGVASGRLAGVLHELDGVTLKGAEFVVWPDCSGFRTGARRRNVALCVVVAGVPCMTGLETLLDLAPLLSDDEWEQALESALRKRLTTIEDIEAAIAGRRGAARMRRVLARRPAGAPPTGSLLETLFVQLARSIPGLREPVRQYEVRNRHGDFVAFVDLAWPELGLFIELDGQQHKGQPVYDAKRQTAVTRATGWRCGRFTWHQVVHLRATTVRDLAELTGYGKYGFSMTVTTPSEIVSHTRTSPSSRTRLMNEGRS